MLQLYCLHKTEIINCDDKHAFFVGPTLYCFITEMPPSTSCIATIKTQY